MSGGRVQLEVSDGVHELLAHPWISGRLEEIVHPAGNPTAGWISLVSVHDVDTAALIAAAPHAAWQAWCGAGTDTPGLWLGYHPSTGLVEADHVDGVLVVPLTTADPDRNPTAAPHLRTLLDLTELLDAAWRREPPAPEHPVASELASMIGGPAVPLVSLADLGVTANRGPQWAEDDIEDALWGRQVIGWDATHPDAPRIGAAIQAAADQLADRVTAGLPGGLRLVDDQVWGPPDTDLAALARGAVRWKERAGFAELVAQTGLWTPPDLERVPRLCIEGRADVVAPDGRTVSELTPRADARHWAVYAMDAHGLADWVADFTDLDTATRYAHRWQRPCTIVCSDQVEDLHPAAPATGDPLRESAPEPGRQPAPGIGR